VGDLLAALHDKRITLWEFDLAPSLLGAPGSEDVPTPRYLSVGVPAPELLIADTK